MRTVRSIRVLVASPSDVGAERGAVKSIGEYVTHVLGVKNARIDILMVETNVTPAIGTRAQAVVNDQLGADYDILLGIMGARFGTSTGKAGSGTEEEFREAVDRWKKTGAPRIMFYFKDSVSSLSDVDPDQLRYFNGLPTSELQLIAKEWIIVPRERPEIQ